MTQRIISRWLLLCAFGVGWAAVSPVYGQYVYSLVEQSGGTVFSSSVLDVSLYDYADGAYVYAALSDPNGNGLDWGDDEEFSWNDYDAYAEVDLEGQVNLTGYFSVYADNYEWYLPIEDWLYLGPTSAGTSVYSGGGGPPVISNISPSSGTYGEGDGWGASGGYIQIYGSNLDPDGATCLPWVSFGSCYWASDDGTQVNLYYDGSAPPGTYPIEIETDGGMYSNQTTFTINGDPTPSISSISPSTWQAGTTVPFTISGSGFGTNPTVQYSCCSDGVSYSTLSDSEIDGTIAVDPNSPAGTLTVMITSNGYNGYSFQGGQQGQSNQTTGTVGVTALTPALTQTPTSLNLSTGDTVQSGTPKYISVSISPNSVNFASTFNTTLYQDPGGACDAVLGFSGSGTGTVNSLVTVPAAQASCSGVFFATAYYPALSGSVNSNASTTVNVPPQELIWQMASEAGGFASNTMPQQSVGWVSRNRFGRWEFGSPASYNDVVNSGQVASGSRPSNGLEPELDNAVAVFTAVAGSDITGGSVCYWSPRNEELPYIQAALSSGTATFPSSIPKDQRPNYPVGTTPSPTPLPGILDPQCFFSFASDGSQTQIVWKASMPNNVGWDNQNAPAFVFEQQRSPGSPSVVQIP